MDPIFSNRSARDYVGGENKPSLPNKEEGCVFQIEGRRVRMSSSREDRLRRVTKGNALIQAAEKFSIKREKNKSVILNKTPELSSSISHESQKRGHSLTGAAFKIFFAHSGLDAKQLSYHEKDPSLKSSLKDLCKQVKKADQVNDSFLTKEKRELPYQLRSLLVAEKNVQATRSLLQKIVIARVVQSHYTTCQEEAEAAGNQNKATDFYEAALPAASAARELENALFSMRQVGKEGTGDKKYLLMKAAQSHESSAAHWSQCAKARAEGDKNNAEHFNKTALSFQREAENIENQLCNIMGSNNRKRERLVPPSR